MWHVYFNVLALMLALGSLAWLYSVFKSNVNIVDSLWPIMFLAGGIYVVLSVPEQTSRNWLVLTLVAVWALRLSVYLAARNWGQPEDRRYQQIRINNSPYFTLKSLYIVFGLQAFIAWLVFAGLLPLLSAPVPYTIVDVIAVAMWFIGLSFEAVADYQLYMFTREPANRGKVLDTGLWRYTRHPNYFGEFLVWWAFFLMAAGSGYWWCLISPLIMTLLLFKVSGVGLMEQGMDERRPGYRRYIERTSTFFPRIPKKDIAGDAGVVDHG